VTKIIYIGGYGHSGSTLLEYLIAGNPGVLACGEVVSVLRTRKRGKCTCGQLPEECQFWGFVYSKDGRSPRCKTHSQLLSALVGHIGGRYLALVDSSKTAWGALSSPFSLRHTFGEDFLLVHLTRQPAAACWSVLKKRSPKGRRAGRRLYSESFRCVWTSLSWSVANLSCEIFRLFFPRQYRHLRYEDLVRAPVEEIGTLLTSVLPQLRWSEDLSGSDNRHQLFGNSVRYRPLSLEAIREDLRWKTEMPREQTLLVLRLTSLLRLRYGY
jgi:hypothetical protein